jgi:hypothetical protein
MKTEIIHSHRPRDGYLIDSVLPLTENKTAVFLGSSILSIDLSEVLNFDTSNYYKCYFNLGEKFGLIHRAERLLLFDIIDSKDYEIVEVSNPFQPDEHDRKTNVERASTFLFDNNFYWG